jgi:phasin family protein
MMTTLGAGVSAAKQAELGKQTFEKALANMRELAEMATKSQTQAWEVVSRRFHENLEELKKLMHSK